MDIALQWWLHQAIKEERPIHKKRETKHLQPLKGFPSQEERDDPDEERPAGIDC